MFQLFDSPIAPLFFVVFGLLLFLVLREVMTWYWKMNRVVDLLEQIEENTRKSDIVHDKDVSGT